MENGEMNVVEVLCLFVCVRAHFDQQPYYFFLRGSIRSSIHNSKFSLNTKNRCHWRHLTSIGDGTSQPLTLYSTGLKYVE